MAGAAVAASGRRFAGWRGPGPGGRGWVRVRAGAAQGEVGDVDLVLAEDGADAADDAGDVVVADGDEGAGERGFDVDAVVGEQAGRGAVEDGGGGGGVGAALALHGVVEDELERRSRCRRWTNSFLSSWMRMPRSSAMAAALMRLTELPPSVSAKMPATAALRMRSVLPVAMRPV